MNHYNIQKTIRALTILLLFCLMQSAYAVLPPTMNYQGHLTDTAGVPIDGPVNMVFAIYDLDTGGTALWSDTRSVTIDQGVFSVELGGGLNPFPLGLFENPLWMGLAVGTDAEMAPRRPISSTAFSFKADDANTLEGISASTLDQSMHVIDNANPHNVTAAQAGAADAAALSAHTGNVSNPHSVSAAQTGAPTNTDFTSHTSNNAAHHSRYTNTEAVSAMGTKNDSNALHHDKYTDSNVVTAMLANDGAGSTLDSDKVDGLEASELIDAAQDEVRTPISALPYNISASGSYYLTGNLDGSSGGIAILTDKVTLDLMGFTIDGGGSANHGIYFNNRNNIVIRNGFVVNFGNAGIYQGNSAGRYATVIDVQALDNGTLGSTNAYSGIYILGSNNHIERCTAGNNGGHGIYVYTSSKLLNNTVYNNSGLYGIFASNASTLSGNTAYNNTGNSGIYGNSGSVITNNTSYDNTGTGINGGVAAYISGNVAYSNGVDGIYASSGASISGNTAHSNGNDGIYGSGGASISGNTAYGNDHWGIYGAYSNLIQDNNLYNNNKSGTVNEGGLRVPYDSRIIGNTLNFNSQNNIYVASSDNTLIDNHVTGSTNGINFVVSGNYYRDNTASGNTANYTGFLPAGSGDGGGNASF